VLVLVLWTIVFYAVRSRPVAAQENAAGSFFSAHIVFADGSAHDQPVVMIVDVAQDPTGPVGSMVVRFWMNGFVVAQYPRSSVTALH